MANQLLLVWGLGCWCCAAFVSAEDWLQWRGRHGNNHAPVSADPLITWDVQRGNGVLWKTKLPGAGHSSPTIVGDSIYLTTADESLNQQLLLAFDRDSGQIRKQAIVHDGGLPSRIHPRNTHASPTVASDGQHVFVVFHNADAIRVTAYDRSLAELWQQKVASFAPASFQFGYGASPILFQDRLIIAAEYDGPGSGLYGLDKKTGKQLWQVERPANLSFSSPVTTRLAGRQQLLLPGADKIESFDPMSGRRLWAAAASTEATCGTIVWDEQRVFISGGNPNAGTWSVLADGSGKLVWENRVMCYEQSLLADRGYVYAVSDSGVAYCWKASNGVEMWKTRLGGGFSSSPLLVNDRIYVCSEAGKTFVFAAQPNRYKPLATNPSGDEIFATPVALGKNLYIRYALQTASGRQEFLTCIGPG